jgi:hypothetical protein
VEISLVINLTTKSTRTRKNYVRVIFLFIRVRLPGAICAGLLKPDPRPREPRLHPRFSFNCESQILGRRFLTLFIHHQAHRNSKENRIDFFYFVLFLSCVVLIYTQSLLDPGASTLSGIVPRVSTFRTWRPKPLFFRALCILRQTHLSESQT